MHRITFNLNKKYKIDTHGELYVVYYVVTEKNGSNINEKNKKKKNKNLKWKQII